MSLFNDSIAFFTRAELISIFGIGISTLIAILLYVLGKKISDAQQISHISHTQDTIDVTLNGAYAKDVELYNSKLYTSKNFAKNKRSRIWGYSYHGAGLRGYDFEGVELIVKLVSWNKKKYHRVGIIPYDRILKVQPRGDSSTNKPILFVRPYIIQKDKYSIAYKKFVYYPIKGGMRVHPPLTYIISTSYKSIFLKLRYQLYYRWRKNDKSKRN